MSWLNRHKHAWSDWSEVKRVTETRATGSFGEVREYGWDAQERTCSTCGVVQRRSL